MIARAVSVPRLAQFRPKTAHGERATSDYVIVQVRTEDGPVGLGEATVDRAWSGEDAISTESLINGTVRDLLLGANAGDWAEVAARLGRLTMHRPFLRAALEMACLDILGKQAGVPVSMLIGGARRTGIPTKFVVPARDPETATRIAATAAERGALALKVKVGIDIAQDAARVAAVREVLPEMHLTVDANEGWGVDEARAALRRMDDFGVAVVEQPVARHAWAALAALRHTGRAAIAGDESIWSEADIVTAAAHSALDIACLYPGKCGGIRRAMTVAAIAGAHGMRVSVGSNLELGVGSAAMAHMLAALPQLSTAMPADLIGPLYHEHSLVTDDSFVRFDGATCPAGPGLGVALDEAAVEHYRLRQR
ncbi:dipeptide epimerase [Dactylosporangium sucinum]|uniref:Dipeptide epimerase n=1 Tax=Dactylosporangium sucinum TaxID=1424081 RepID=A0A917U8G2_9ACTN|nr:dipeptide epimerase [Dactylosporangium sucinum]